MPSKGGMMERTMHSLKTDPQVFEAVITGKKTYEIRKNDDRAFKVGDFLRLLETQHTGEEMKAAHVGGCPGRLEMAKPLVYTGRKCLAEITHILNGPAYGLMAGWSLLSLGGIEDVSDKADAPSTEKKPRLFYFEEAENVYIPAPDNIENLIDVKEQLEDGEIMELRFKRIDLSDDEMAALPEC